MTVSFRFYGYLNDFLPPFRRGFRFRQILGTHWSVRDALVAVRVPYSRVDVVVVNGTPVDFSYVLEPALHSLARATVSMLQPARHRQRGAR